MTRVLDIDLDFFVRPVAHYVADDGPRLPEGDYGCLAGEEVVAFLRNQCGLTRRLPGWVVEHHDEAFARWRAAIAGGLLKPPFHVTHVDAHADLGNGDNGFRHLITRVMPRPVEERSAQELVEPAIGCGNWLAFAVACRWVSDLDYVFCPGGGDDLLSLHMSADGAGLQLKAATDDAVDDTLYSFGKKPLVGESDPLVPLRQISGEEFAATEPFDAIVLCRSPGFTTASADEIFELIRRGFVEQIG